MNAPEAAKTDMPQKLLKLLWNDLLIALALLTRLPVPHADFSDTSRPAARSAWAYPLVGLVVGGLAVGVGWLAAALSLPALICAACVAITLTLVTGAMHEDGLADCADGFWGGWTPARRLEIMKDSAIGTYGTLALVAAFALKLLAIGHILATDALPLWVILIPAVMSRAAMVALMELMPNARETGLSAATGRPGKPAMWAALLIAFLAALAAPAGPAAPILAAVFITATLGLIARAKINGQTGDVLGACQALSEIAVLAALLR